MGQCAFCDSKGMDVDAGSLHCGSLSDLISRPKNYGYHVEGTSSYLPRRAHMAAHPMFGDTRAPTNFCTLTLCMNSYANKFLSNNLARR